ncbi:distal tail protein Dit [Clostridium perfringens]|uniref:distal tail protein Dit n=1 Tax=Clostridium perfringens TaxID=1502 RepID=UPI00232AE7B5|nr:distal tail protein Dit [Clostridium perfringens]MDB2049346.1 phage tail family protein [Clostridium perfringens]
MYSYFNDADLSELIKIKKVTKPLLPSTQHTTIDIWERQGKIFDDMKQDEFPIKIDFMVRPSLDMTIDEKLHDLRLILLVNEPKPLYLKDSNKFAFAIPIGEITLTKKCPTAVEGTLSMMCYDPAYYSDIAKQFDGSNLITCENEGDYKCYPIISVGISKTCQFVQVENTENNKKILVGNIPNPYFEQVEESKYILIDECESTEGWSAGTSMIDSNRGFAGGVLGLTSNGKGLMVGSYSSGSELWKGVSARKNFAPDVPTLKDFIVEATMSHKSTGINGDPERGQNKTHNEAISTGSRTKYYEVTASSTNVRERATTSSKKVGTLKKGEKVTPKSVSKSWVRFNYKGKDRYVSTKYMKVKYKDNTTTVTTKNFVTNDSTNLRESYKKTSKIKCSIPKATTLRIISSKKYLDPTDKKKKRYYYKLAEKYKGHTGYVAVTQVIQASDVSYEYDEELETADDKTGIIEVYGWGINGEKIFRMGLYDDDKFWEFTYPLIQVGSTDFLKDKTVAPTPKKKTEISGSDDKLTVKEETYLSGEYGDWNNFYGKLGIQRKNGKWKAWVYKIKDGKTVKSYPKSETTVYGSPTAGLAYITMYQGTQDPQKSSGLSLSHLKVQQLNKVNPATTNVQKFKCGDVIKFDCFNSVVYLNGKEYNNVDIGSQFFPLETGENIIKLRSDDDDLSTEVIYNERWT